MLLLLVLLLLLRIMFSGHNNRYGSAVASYGGLLLVHIEFQNGGHSSLGCSAYAAASHSSAMMVCKPAAAF
jgi:hypothetical protein